MASPPSSRRSSWLTCGSGFGAALAAAAAGLAGGLPAVAGLLELVLAAGLLALAGSTDTVGCAVLVLSSALVSCRLSGAPGLAGWSADTAGAALDGRHYFWI